MRVPDDLWEEAQQIAKANGETLSEAIRAALEQYIAESTLREGAPPELALTLHAAACHPWYMPAPVSRQFMQLPMFMKASEFDGMHLPDRHYDFQKQELEPVSRLWARKRSENPAQEAHFRRNGFSDPVDVSHGYDGGMSLLDGHHRVAIAHRMGPNTLVPVAHHQPPPLSAVPSD